MIEQISLRILIIIFLSGNLISLTLWIQLFNYIFQFKINKLFLIILSIVSGIISATIILAIPHLGSNFFDFTKNISNQWLGIYLWLFLSTIIFSIHLILNGKNTFRQKNFFIIFFIFSLIFIGISFVITSSSLDSNIKYFIFVALSEEFVKFMFGSSLFFKYKIIDNDIIIFSIISALGFSFVENIVYLFYFLQDKPEYIWGSIIGLLLTRGIIGFLVHSIFTGNIGLGHLIGFIKGYLIIFGLIGILIGIGLHSIYNILISQGFWFISIFMIIFGYLWLSWLLYNSDRLYVWYKKEI